MVYKIILFTILLILPSLINACPMCQGGPTEDTITAYKVVTLMLTSLPLILGGGIFWWVRKQQKN